MSKTDCEETGCGTCSTLPDPRRDTVYGQVVTRRLKSMGIRDWPTVPRSPRQNGCVERLMGSIRRECFDHLVVFGSPPPHRRKLRRLLQRAPDTPVAEQRRPNSSTDAPDRADRSSAHARWPTPPILSNVVSGRDTGRNGAEDDVIRLLVSSAHLPGIRGSRPREFSVQKRDRWLGLWSARTAGRSASNCCGTRV